MLHSEIRCKKYIQKTKKKNATTVSSTVATVQNLNKRVKKIIKKKKEIGLTKLLLQIQCCTVKYVGCTVPKHCSGHWCFLYILGGAARVRHVLALVKKRGN